MPENSFDNQKLVQLKGEVFDSDFLSSLISSIASEGILIMDENQRIFFFNKGAENIFGYSEFEIFGQTIDRLIPARFIRSHQDHVARFKKEPDPSRGMKERKAEISGLRKNGEEFPLEVSISRLNHDNHTVFTAIFRDVTERKLIENREAQTLSLLSATLESSADGILAVDKEGKNIIVYNNPFLKMWRVPDSVLEKIKDAKDDRPLLSYVTTQVKDPETFLSKVKELYCHPTEDSFDILELNDGRVFERHSKPQLVGNENIGRVWTFRDVTLRALSEQRLIRLANFDPLTGLPNRNLLFDRLELAMARAKWSKRFIGVLYIDLDGFKKINDTRGHKFGDLFLKAVSERLKTAIRDGDTVGRLGGDEFVFLLDNIAQLADTRIVAQKILNALKEPIIVEGDSLAATASIGIAVFPEDGKDYETLLRNADTAMYLAKNQRKSSYQFYSPF